jgi:hypothetical protein
MFKYLTDADADPAEALILDQLAGKTYPQVLRLAERAALIVDPELAERRRQQVQKEDARVTLFRELSGTAGLSGRDLPPDEALAAMAAVNARAQQYEDSGAFGDTPMDVLRVRLPRPHPGQASRGAHRLRRGPGRGHRRRRGARLGQRTRSAGESRGKDRTGWRCS